VDVGATTGAITSRSSSITPADRWRRPDGTLQRTAALAPWLDHDNTQRRHSALAGHPPTSRLSPT